MVNYDFRAYHKVNSFIIGFWQCSCFWLLFSCNKKSATTKATLEKYIARVAKHNSQTAFMRVKIEPVFLPE